MPPGSGTDQGELQCLLDFFAKFPAVKRFGQMKIRLRDIVVIASIVPRTQMTGSVVRYCISSKSAKAIFARQTDVAEDELWGLDGNPRQRFLGRRCGRDAVTPGVQAHGQKAKT